VILLATPGHALASAAADRLGAPVTPVDPQAPPPVEETVVLVLAGAPASEADAGRQAWWIPGLLARWRDRDGRLPARFAILDEGGDGLAAVRSALVGTAVRYVAGSLFHGGPSVNCVRPVDGAAVPYALDALVALTSGLLDAARGQTLVVGTP
jgi:hypothetical protein